MPEAEGRTARIDSEILLRNSCINVLSPRPGLPANVSGDHAWKSAGLLFVRFL